MCTSLLLSSGFASVFRGGAVGGGGGGAVQGSKRATAVSEPHPHYLEGIAPIVPTVDIPKPPFLQAPSYHELLQPDRQSYRAAE